MPAAAWARFTSEQLRAALLIDRPVVAPAGAGAGKTAVMAVRYCACLLDHDRDGRRLGPDRVLAIAFTREAAANLRARVDRTLRAVLTSGAFPGPGPDGIADRPLADEARAHLATCLGELPAAPITTFDGLCVELVGEHAARLGRDPDLAPPDELAWSACAERAWRRLRGQAVAARDADLIDLVTAWGEERLIGMVRRLADQAGALPEAAVRAAASDALTALRTRRQDQLDEAIAALAQARGLARRGVLGDGIAAIPPQPDADPRALRAWLVAGNGLVMTGNRDVALKAAVTRLRMAIWHPASKKSQALNRASLLALAYGDAEAERDRVRRAERLAAVVERFRVLRDAEAETVGIAGFARLEAEALRLIADRATRRALAGRFVHALVDEAQDLNRLQSALAEALSAEGTRLFVVGDHRQSIFGFRHADPAVFSGWIAAIADAPQRSAGTRPLGEVVPLAHNFRSHPAVVDGIAAIFGQREFANRFAVDAIVAGCTADQFAGAGLVGLWQVDADPQAPDLSAVERTAAWCAARIAAGIAAGRCAGDHAIVLRARTHMRAYAVALERVGVPYDTDFPGGLYDSQECHDVEALMRLAASPGDRMAWAVALGGPWGVADHHDLALTSALCRSGPGDAAVQIALTRDTRLPGILAELRGLLASEGAAAAVRALARSPVLARRYAGMPLARRRLANLALLADEERSAGAPLDAHALVERWRERRRLGVDAGEAAGEEIGGRGVRLMTIHGAKGLEWPVVLVPGLERDFGFERRDLTLPVLGRAGAHGLELLCGLGDDEREMAGGRDREPPPPLALLLAREDLRARLLAEEARLLYVACTRARAELHLVSAQAPVIDASPRRPVDWLADPALAAAGLIWRQVVAPEVSAVVPPPPMRSTLPPLASAGPAATTRLLALTDLVERVVPAPEVTVGGSARHLARAVGTACHLALRRHGHGMPAAAASAVLAPWAAQLGDARARALAGALADPGLVPGYWAASRRLHEQPVVGAIASGLLVSAQIDLLIEDADGSWRLFDYKSGAAVDGPAARMQVRCYAGLCAGLLPGPLTGAWLVDLERRSLVAVPITDADLTDAWQHLRQAACQELTVAKDPASMDARPMPQPIPSFAPADPRTFGPGTGT